jgi:pilus assembly protein CpaF
MGDDCCATCGMFAGKEPPAEVPAKPLEGQPTQFTILIAEQGGAQRAYTPEGDVVKIGRVQGNHIVLPKGNVSKFTSQIVFRDGKAIIADMKSTCGTYVNGRKITTPVVINEDAKIYIGDFVLQVRRV